MEIKQHRSQGRLADASACSYWGGETRAAPASEYFGGRRGAVLKVEGSAVCIGDAETLHGYGPVMTTPLVLGHEIVGRVTEVGPEAPPSLKEFTGARVLIDDARPCGQCEWCARDQKRFVALPGTDTLFRTPYRETGVATPKR